MAATRHHILGPYGCKKLQAEPELLVIAQVRHSLVHLLGRLIERTVSGTQRLRRSLILERLLKHFVRLFCEPNDLFQEHGLVFTLELRHILESYGHPRQIQLVKVKLQALQDALEELIIADMHLIARFDDIDERCATSFRKEGILVLLLQHESLEHLEGLGILVTRNDKVNLSPSAQQVGNG